MLRWEHLATAHTPGGGALRLLRRGAEFSIRMEDGGELMNSRVTGSETSLARLALADLAAAPAPRILIGGLGMGFTLRAVQDLAGPAARITVAEIVPDIVAWAAGPLAEIFGDSLSDSRVDLRTGDVGEVMAAARACYDAILLDVDNGPDGLTRPENDALYGAHGLAAARLALVPGGVLAVWSAAPDTGFTGRLRRAGLEARAVEVRAGRGRRGARHTIWIARRLPDR